MRKNYPGQEIKSYFSNNDDRKLFDFCSISSPDYPESLNESLCFFNHFDKLDEESEINIKDQYSNNLSKIEIPDKIEEKKTTAISTKVNTLLYVYEQIKNILKDDSFNQFKKIIDKCKEAPEIEEIGFEMKFISKPRKEYGTNKDTYNHISNNIRGRKKVQDKTPEDKTPENKTPEDKTPEDKTPIDKIPKDKIPDHNKKSPDNIIKKIKGYFISFLITFVNSIIREKEDRLKSLDYIKYIDPLKRYENLNLLKMTVKDCLSRDTSPKYIKSKADYNIIKINKILNEEKDNEVIKFVFNMTIKDWIEIYTMKKNICDFEIGENLTIIEYDKIQSKIPSIKDLFKEIMEKNKDDEIYFTKFVFYLYNYEKWFLIKRERKREQKI